MADNRPLEQVVSQDAAWTNPEKGICDGMVFVKIITFYMHITLADGRKFAAEAAVIPGDGHEQQRLSYFTPSKIDEIIAACGIAETLHANLATMITMDDYGIGPTTPDYKWKGDEGGPLDLAAVVARMEKFSTISEPPPPLMSSAMPGKG